MPRPFDSETGKAAQKLGSPPPPAMRHLTDPNLREIRGKEIVERRVAGMTVGEVATATGLSQATIEREVKWMKTTGRIQKYESKVVNLVPDAITAVRGALAKGDARIAIKILEMLLKLGDRAAAADAKQSDRTADLGDYVQKQLIRESLKAARANTTPDATEDPTLVTIEASPLDPSPLYAPEHSLLPDHGPSAPPHDGPGPSHLPDDRA